MLLQLGGSGTALVQMLLLGGSGMATGRLLLLGGSGMAIPATMVGRWWWLA